MVSILRGFIIDNLGGFSYRNIPNFLISFLICAALCYLLSRLYIRYGNALSNRKVFARNFIVLGLTTMFIITVVKNSLALSLGLVGALSIVRFRSAIKEPEELTYLFLTIAIGLGCGAGLTVLTIVAFIGFTVVIWTRRRSVKPLENQNLYLTVKTSSDQGVPLDKIAEALRNNLPSVKLKRSDEDAHGLEASFVVEVTDYRQFEKMRQELKSLNPALVLTFMDTSRDF